MTPIGKSSSFLEDLLGVGDAAIQKLFSRNDPNIANVFTDSRIDGDYAQMISINSEFGVLPYLSGNYSDSISVNKSLMGIWFTGSTISPYNTVGTTVAERRLLGPGQLTFNEPNPFITSDFKYHEFFDADKQLVIADIGHFESEQYTSHRLERILTKKFTKFAVHLTKENTNPIKYF